MKGYIKYNIFGKLFQIIGEDIAKTPNQTNYPNPKPPSLKVRSFVPWHF